MPSPPLLDSGGHGIGWELQWAPPGQARVFWPLHMNSSVNVRAAVVQDSVCRAREIYHHMASTDRITALRKFFPPAAALQPCTLDDARTNLRDRSSTAFPCVGLLATRGLVWEATGEPCRAGLTVPPGHWRCVACAKTGQGIYAPKVDTDYGFGKANDHWKVAHQQKVSLHPHS